MVVEQNTANLQVAMFKYDKVKGCSNTTSLLHGLLPVPSKQHQVVVELTHEPRLHVGFEYIHGLVIPNKIVEAKLKYECRARRGWCP